MPENNESKKSFKVGNTFRKTWQFDVQSVKDFATLVGDLNPIHHDEAFAKNSPFGKLIVSSTQYSAMMIGMVATYSGECNMSVGLNFDFQLKKAIYADEAVEMVWEITKIEPNAKLQGDIVSMEGVIYNSQQQICTTAQTKVLSYNTADE